MNSKNKFVYLDQLTVSINPIHHKLINEILLSDSITVIYNELLPSLPADVLRNLYLNIHYNLNLFTPEQIEKLKPIGNFYANIKFTCSTQCNPVNNPGRLPLQDKEYGTKKDCRSKCESINDTLDSFLSLDDKLKYLISINKKELISTIQEKDIYNTDNILKRESPLYNQFRPYVITAEESQYKANPYEYKNVKYLYKIYWDQGFMTYDVIYEKGKVKETITAIRFDYKYNHTGDHLVFRGKPLTEKQSITLRKLYFVSINDSLVNVLSKLTQLKVLGISRSTRSISLSKLTQLETLILGDLYNKVGFDHPLGDSLSKLTQLKDLKLYLGNGFNHPLGDSLSKLTQLKELDLGTFKQPLGDSLSKLTQLEKLNLGAFNQPLGESLSKLYQLKELDLGKFNQPLGDSLSKLTQLEKLNLGAFNQPLGESLSKLYQLKKLNLKSYIEPFVDSLSKLTQLEELDINPENAHIARNRAPFLSENFNIWLRNLKQLKVVRYGGREQIYNSKPSFSFTRKNSVDKKTKKKLIDIDFKSRRSPRKSSKRRSPRKSPKRRSPRKSPRRRSPRKSPKRRSPRKSSKRRSPRKSKRSPKRKSQ
jgi:peptidyl-prolyl isomerase G (cyclophilin G)/arginine/serine-rich splicing factor 7/serine/arginine repetitive matrix protein 1